MSDKSDHPTAGRRRKKSPLVAHLAPPVLPDHLRGDDDGPICCDEEKEAKRMRSASDTPRSVRGADPDDYDRVMGVNETVRFGAGDATDINSNQEGVANSSGNTDEARERTTANVAIPTPYTTSMEDDPGAGIDSRGYGRASLLVFE